MTLPLYVQADHAALEYASLRRGHKPSHKFWLKLRDLRTRDLKAGRSQPMKTERHRAKSVSELPLFQAAS